MNLAEACAQLNRRGSGPATHVDVVECEDGESLLVYAYFRNSGPIATCLLPRSIRGADDKSAVIQNSAWMVHDYPEHED